MTVSISQSLVMMSTSVWLLAVIFGIVTSTERKTYQGYHVISVTPETEEELEHVRRLKENFGDKVLFMKEPHFLRRDVTMAMDAHTYPQVKKQLQSRDIEFHIRTKNLQSVIERENTIVKRNMAGDASFHLDQYNGHADMLSWMDDVASRCPMCSTFSIGESYEGRDLRVIKMSSTNISNPSIWIDAGIHAREWIAPATALWIINEIVEGNHNEDEGALSLLQNFNVYIMPCVNPDGYEYSIHYDRLWRKTRSPNKNSKCVGTDGNRNFNFHWMEGGASKNPCAEDYAGPYPFSEPETKALADFLLKEGNFLLYLSIHSYGQMWVSPWGYTDDLPDDFKNLMQIADASVRAIKIFSKMHYITDTSTRALYIASGGSDDWAKGVAGIRYSYTVELRDEGRHGFILPKEQIPEQGQEMWLAIQAAARAIREACAR